MLKLFVLAPGADNDIPYTGLSVSCLATLVMLGPVKPHLWSIVYLAQVSKWSMLYTGIIHSYIPPPVVENAYKNTKHTSKMNSNWF